MKSTLDLAAGHRSSKRCAAALLALATTAGSADANVSLGGEPGDGTTRVSASATVTFEEVRIFNEDTGQSEVLIPAESILDEDTSDYSGPNLGLPDLLNAAVPMTTRTFVDTENGVTVNRTAFGFSDLLIVLEEDSSSGITELSSTITHDVSYIRTPAADCCSHARAQALTNVGFRLVVTGRPMIVHVEVEFSGDRGSGAGLSINGSDLDITKDFNDENEPAFNDSAMVTLQPGSYRFQQYSYANARSNILGTRDFEGEITVRFERAPPRVVLAFGEGANAAVREDEVFGASFHNVIVDGQATLLPFTTPDQSAFTAFKEAIRASVQDVLDRASAGGIALEDAEVVVGPAEQYATNIFFVDADQLAVPGLEGRAYTGVDQFDEAAHGEAFVVVRPNFASDVERIAERTAHEVGHLLGLIHINPGGAQPVMDYDHLANQQETFSNGIFALTQPPRTGGLTRNDITHNPLYHLLRNAGGRSHEELSAALIFPGTWDLQRAAVLGVTLAANFESGGSGMGNATPLYDVSVLEADGDPAVPSLLRNFAEITFDELSQQEFEIRDGSGLLLFAASEPGGERDIALALDDPFAEYGLVVYPGSGEQSALLQRESDTPEGYETLASVTLGVTKVPEPSVTTMSLAAVSMVLAWRARRRRAERPRLWR